MCVLCVCACEDMNLNEERKAPLREKDLSTKREMVVQYISATAKSVSDICRSFIFKGRRAHWNDYHG